MNSSWVVTALQTQGLDSVRTDAERRLLTSALGYSRSVEPDARIRFSAEAMEIAVLDLLSSTPEHTDALRTVSEEAFKLLRAVPRPKDPLEAAKLCLRIGCIGILADKGRDASRLLTEKPWPALPANAEDWEEQTLSSVLDLWLCIIRKHGWEDLDAALNSVLVLRQQQKRYEEKYLNSVGASARSAARNLAALYHLARAGEILATYTSQGQVDGRFDVQAQLEAQFDRALAVCGRGELLELSYLVQLLAHTARQLVDNCIWTVTRGAPEKISQFVHHLASRQQRRPIFEVLPPQRRALREGGLSGAGYRSVVVNLPTSSGKTFIAQFRMLQALNQFDSQRGWVAYLVPTRALVNQIATRLRRDFLPLEVSVEKVSPALEIDGLEARLLTDKDVASAFRVLVTTPEKLDLMLRGGWEEKIGRPLTLVVVDEAHHLAQRERGIKLELLLATINRECKYAQFLLLTPFIINAAEIARWLSPDNFAEINLSLHWQPNDRAIALSRAIRSKAAPKRFSLELETIHTTKHTLAIPESLPLGSESPLGLSWSAVKDSSSRLAAATAQVLKQRGPVIVLAQRPDWAWSLARLFMTPENKLNKKGDGIQLVQQFLDSEFGSEFELKGLLDYGIGVHHSGLSDELRFLMEWLFETEEINILVATTTIAQGVNFPISGVVLAHNKYYQEPMGTIDMPPEDFWNLAGRAGRVEQGTVGVVALAAKDDAAAADLRSFVGTQVTALNSTLVDMVQTAMSQWGTVNLQLLSPAPEWSAFLQYLAHTYRQIGDPEKFAAEIEQVLRGTLGFQALRRTNVGWASKFIESVQEYGGRLAGKPLKLVDTTGFSWETVNATLGRLSAERVTSDVWDADKLFKRNSRDLQKLMGILLAIPELRANLTAATGGRGPDGDRLAHMVSDWVNGTTLAEMTEKYFAIDRKGKTVELTDALGACCKNLYGKLAQTTCWGLAALQAMTWGDKFDKLPEDDQQTIRNLPARVFYGVNTDEAIALRMVGVPRGAAQRLANILKQELPAMPLPKVRETLAMSDDLLWARALGDRGASYRQIWRVLEGLA
jgi:superfamily II DNA/RNA helicase